MSEGQRPGMKLSHAQFQNLAIGIYPVEMKGFVAPRRDPAQHRHPMTRYYQQAKEAPVQPLPETLHATQREVYADVIDEHTASPGRSGEKGETPYPVAVKKRGRTWVLDGHHRVLAQRNRGQQPMGHLLDLD